MFAFLLWRVVCASYGPFLSGRFAWAVPANDPFLDAPIGIGFMAVTQLLLFCSALVAVRACIGFAFGASFPCTILLLASADAAI